jgi:hypothetical protein
METVPLATRAIDLTLAWEYVWILAPAETSFNASWILAILLVPPDAPPMPSAFPVIVEDATGGSSMPMVRQFVMELFVWTQIVDLSHFLPIINALMEIPLLDLEDARDNPMDDVDGLFDLARAHNSIWGIVPLIVLTDSNFPPQLQAVPQLMMPTMLTMLARLADARILLRLVLLYVPRLCALSLLLDLVFNPLWWMDAVQCAPSVITFIALPLRVLRDILSRDFRDNVVRCALQWLLASLPCAPIPPHVPLAINSSERTAAVSVRG